MAKDRTAQQASKGTELDRKARDEEAAWLRRNPGVDLPGAVSRPSRAERFAQLTYQHEHGDDRTKERVCALLQKEKQEAAEEDRLRPHRIRPEKNLPPAYVEVSFREEPWPAVERAAHPLIAALVPWPGPESVVTVVPDDDESEDRPSTAPRPDDLRALALYDDLALHVDEFHKDVEPFERVSLELAMAAQVLRRAFDVEVYDRRSFDSPELACKMRVRSEIANAIRDTVARLAGEMCATLAIELVQKAIRERWKSLRGDVEMVEFGPRDESSPEPAPACATIYEDLVAQMLRLGLPLPEHIHAGTVAWMLERMAPGRRGGAKKLGTDKMRELLADPAKLAKEIADTHAG